MFVCGLEPPIFCLLTILSFLRSFLPSSEVLLHLRLPTHYCFTAALSLSLAISLYLVPLFLVIPFLHTLVGLIRGSPLLSSPRPLPPHLHHHPFQSFSALKECTALCSTPSPRLQLSPSHAHSVCCPASLCSLSSAPSISQGTWHFWPSARQLTCMWVKKKTLPLSTPSLVLSLSFSFPLSFTLFVPPSTSFSRFFWNGAFSDAQHCFKEYTWFVNRPTFIGQKF